MAPEFVGQGCEAKYQARRRGLADSTTGEYGSKPLDTILTVVRVVILSEMAWPYPVDGFEGYEFVKTASSRGMRGRPELGRWWSGKDEVSLVVGPHVLAEELVSGVRAEILTFLIHAYPSPRLTAAAQYWSSSNPHLHQPSIRRLETTPNFLAPVEYNGISASFDSKVVSQALSDSP